MVTEHIVSAFEDELKALDNRIAQMGGLAEQLLGRAIDSLENRDPGLAEATIRQDEQIDRLEREVEDMAISMIARRQPMAVDLRQIMTAVRVAGDLERIGDLGKNIAKRAMAIAAENRPKQLMIGIRHIGNKSLEQLTDVLDAYSQRDAEKALRVWRRDEELDAIYNSVFRELLTYMMEDPRNIGLCTHLLFGAKNLERIGDHATNIAEMIHFLVTGRPVTEQRPKGDTTSFVMPEKPTA
ncbi:MULTISPECIES: phosphate signaling complex protein PhoU [Rhodomicrobium]|uniref:phosphate signaling complex protein PhoU n=1 Tax=Rhodomicrobium TaxID=1068 RepID=UPI000B4A6C1F|nr:MULTISPECIES: phosphate signaling complex protein PhoU [Rhodomicrobium]